MRYIISARPITPNPKVRRLQAKTKWLVATLRLWRDLYGNLERITITRENQK